MLSRTQARPGRAVKQEQEQNSRYHVQAFLLVSVGTLPLTHFCHPRRPGRGRGRMSVPPRPLPLPPQCNVVLFSHLSPLPSNIRLDSAEMSDSASNFIAATCSQHDHVMPVGHSSILILLCTLTIWKCVYWFFGKKNRDSNDKP